MYIRVQIIFGKIDNIKIMSFKNKNTDIFNEWSGYSLIHALRFG